MRKVGKYAAGGVSRYWVAGPDGDPEIIEYHLVAGSAAYAEAARHPGDRAVTLDIGVAEIAIVPSALVD